MSVDLPSTGSLSSSGDELPQIRRRGVRRRGAAVHRYRGNEEEEEEEQQEANLKKPLAVEEAFRIPLKKGARKPRRLQNASGIDDASRVPWTSANESAVKTPIVSSPKIPKRSPVLPSSTSPPFSEAADVNEAPVLSAGLAVAPEKSPVDSVRRPEETHSRESQEQNVRSRKKRRFSLQRRVAVSSSSSSDMSPSSPAATPLEPIGISSGSSGGPLTGKTLRPRPSKKDAVPTFPVTPLQPISSSRTAPTSQIPVGKLRQQPVYELTSKQDISQNFETCYVCGESKDDPPLLQRTATNQTVVNGSVSYDPSSVYGCYGCLRTYHATCLEHCLEECFLGREDSRDDSLVAFMPDQPQWLCPKCWELPIQRQVTFFRYGEPTRPQTLVRDEAEPLSHADYMQSTIGLTGYLDGCGHCGGPSSQRRIAVLCDHCDREWHLSCLRITELPAGNWFCPDCLDLRLCASCVFRARASDTETPSQTSPGEPPEDRSIAGTVPYFHEGPLIRCGVCYLKYHPGCLGDALPAHLLRALNAQRWDPGLPCSEPSEFWCCHQCQDVLGVQRIISARIWGRTSSSSTSETQLLVKWKGLSYRRISWLPLSRTKTVYPTGTRKWLLSDEAERLGLASETSRNKFNSSSTGTDSTSQPGNRDVQDSVSRTSSSLWTSETPTDAPVPFADEEEDEPENDGITDDDSERDPPGLAKNAAQNKMLVDFASLDKQLAATFRGFDLAFRRPTVVKKEWFLPARVIGRRTCPRGRYRNEFLVKWAGLSYEEVSWEPFQTVRGSRALDLFLSCSAIEKLAQHQPSVVIPALTEDKSPTASAPNSSEECPGSVPQGESDSLLPEGATLVQGKKFIVSTSASPTHGVPEFSPNDPFSSACDTHRPEMSSNGRNVATSTTAPSDETLERQKKEFALGGFVPFYDRPLLLKGKYLFDYQLEGINWMRYSWTKRCSVILADEMGLGKTVQVISFLASLWNDACVQGPFLVIAPLATLEDVWVRELARWAPFMNVVAYFGNPEARQICRQFELFSPVKHSGTAEQWVSSVFKKEMVPEFNRPPTRPRLPKPANKDCLAKFDLLVTSYEIFRKDLWLFRSIKWKVIVVDEGHRLKNFGSEAKRGLETCSADMRLLLTGTPLQNSIDELFSLLNVLHPEKFPATRKDEFQDVVTQEGTIERLKTELQPHILRRTKRDVMGGRMPAKKERLVLVENTSIQKEIYKNILLGNHDLLTFAQGGTTATKTKQNLRATSLRNIVMQLRKCCNHPYLFEDHVPAILTDSQFTHLIESSGKLKLLDRMLALLIHDGHRVLIFSQFMKMLNILEEYLAYRKYGYERLDGSTSAADRQRSIDRFNTQPTKTFVFLLSTRAGGVGINLTSADTVVLFDSDWNPHNDLQAQARAHRLGQTKKVAIFRFVTRASVEERIIEIARDKLVLDQVVSGRISPRDVETVIRCGARELFDDPGTSGTPNKSKEVHYDDAQVAQLLQRDDENDELAKSDTGEDRDEHLKNEKSGILWDSFKVARFEESQPSNPVQASTPGSYQNSDMEDDPGFWVHLLENKLPSDATSTAAAATASLHPAESPTSTHHDPPLGRGMRLRKEAGHYTNTSFRDAGYSLDSDDDEDDGALGVTDDDRFSCERERDSDLPANTEKRKGDLLIGVESDGDDEADEKIKRPKKDKKQKEKDFLNTHGTSSVFGDSSDHGGFPHSIFSGSSIFLAVVISALLWYTTCTKHKDNAVNKKLLEISSIHFVDSHHYNFDDVDLKPRGNTASPSSTDPASISLPFHLTRWLPCFIDHMRSNRRQVGLFDYGRSSGVVVAAQERHTFENNDFAVLGLDTEVRGSKQLPFFQKTAIQVHYFTAFRLVWSKLWLRRLLEFWHTPPQRLAANTLPFILKREGRYFLMTTPLNIPEACLSQRFLQNHTGPVSVVILRELGQDDIKRWHHHMFSALLRFQQNYPVVPLAPFTQSITGSSATSPQPLDILSVPTTTNTRGNNPITTPTTASNNRWIVGAVAASITSYVTPVYPDYGTTQRCYNKNPPIVPKFNKGVTMQYQQPPSAESTSHNASETTDSSSVFSSYDEDQDDQDPPFSPLCSSCTSPKTTLPKACHVGPTNPGVILLPFPDSLEHKSNCA